MCLCLSSPAYAQSQTTVPLVTGEVTLANATRFTAAIANRVDTVVGLQITVSPADDLDHGFLVDEASEGAYISKTEPQRGGVQINAPSAYWRHGSWVIDGFYVVKYGGMGQGIMGYSLTPTDEGAVRLSGVPIREVDVNDLPLEPRLREAD